MFAKVCSAAVNGIEAFAVEVEVFFGWGDNTVITVGLPDAAVRESRDRVSTALTNSGFKFPMGREQLTWEGKPIDLTRPWQRLTLREAITQYAGVPPERLETRESVRAVLEEKGLEIPAGGTYGHLLMGLFEDTVEEHLFAPVFITEHPTDVSPLSKQRPDDPRFTERFELYIAGMELVNAFSELNDPDVQAERFRQQLAAREAGDVEAHLFDADYVRALEHAMPPAAGNGTGIDRLTMLLTDRQSIRDVILFPLMRPEAE